MADKHNDNRKKIKYGKQGDEPKTAESKNMPAGFCPQTGMKPAASAKPEVKTNTKSQKMALQSLGVMEDKKNTLRPEEKETYLSRANSFPVMVMQSGLAQTSGFYLAKGNDKQYTPYLCDIANVLASSGNWAFQGAIEFHRFIIDCDTVTYRLLTRDTLTAAGWLKRYGAAIL